MIYLWLILPIIFGFIYMVVCERYPELGEKLEAITSPIVKAIGYALGIMFILAIVWGMFNRQ